MERHIPTPSKSEYTKHLHQYIMGFALSVTLTLAAYFFTTNGISGWPLFISLSVMALAQFAIQIWFFLHVRDEAEPRWKLQAFNLAMILLTIFIVGTLWIMRNLDYHMMTKDGNKDYNEFIVKDEGIGN